MLGEDRRDLPEPGALGLRDALRDQAGRDIHAVQHVADVVQHVGGHFGHAGLAGRDHQLLVYVLELLFSEAAFGDVLDHRHGAECLSGRTDEPARAGERGTHGAGGCDDHELGVADAVTAQRPRQRTLLGGDRRRAIQPIDMRGDRVGAAGEGGRVVRGNSKQLDGRAVVVRHPSGDIARQQCERQFGNHGREQRLVLQQGRRHLLARGYVAQELDRTHRLRAAGANQRGAHANPQRAAVLANVALLDVQMRDVAAPQARMTGDRGLAVLCECEARDRLAAELFDTESEHRAKCPIAVTKAPIGVREGNADRRMLDGVAKQRVHLPEVRGCFQRLLESGKQDGLGACELHRRARSLGPRNVRYDT